MSFWKIAGEFAKEFGKGYVQERGVKGTLEDVGSLAQGIKSFFGSDSSSDNSCPDMEWDEMTEILDEFIQEKEFNKATELLDGYYQKYENSEPDAVYYYLRGEIIVSLLEDEPLLDDYMEMNKLLTEAIDEGRSYRTKELKENFNELAKRQKEALDSHKEMKVWSDMYDNVYDLCDKGYFDEAVNVVESHYAKYEKDIWYPFYLAKINIFRYENELRNGRTPSDSEIAATEALVAKVARFDNSQEHLTELNNKLASVKQRIAATVNSSSPKPASAEDGSSAEQEYIAELKECLSNGIISDRERRLLDKLRKSLGISEERAAQLEAECDPSKLSSEEEEYASELREALADGEISDRERRLFEKLRKSLGISEERAAEIEQLICK